MCKTVQEFSFRHTAQVFRMAFAMDRKLSAGVNASLQISSSELNRRLILKSAASFRMRRDPAD